MLASKAAMLERHPGCAGVATVLLGQLLVRLTAVDGIIHAQHLRKAPAVVLL